MTNEFISTLPEPLHRLRVTFLSSDVSEPPRGDLSPDWSPRVNGCPWLVGCGGSAGAGSTWPDSCSISSLTLKWGGGVGGQVT